MCDDVAPDGSPVAVYLRLPAGEVPAMLHAAVTYRTGGGAWTQRFSAADSTTMRSPTRRPPPACASSARSTPSAPGSR